MRQYHADSGGKNGEMDACSHRLVGKTHEDTVGTARDAMCNPEGIRGTAQFQRTEDL
jgi:hypothetical protein